MSVIDQSPSLDHIDRDTFTESEQGRRVELAAVVATISGIAALATGIVGILTLAH